MRLPDFIIIGSAKSGTTTLYEYLCRHPRIYMSHPKEPEFFARDNVYEKGLDWYSSLFSEAQSNQLCGEASTIYTRSPQFPEAAARMAQAIPQVKLIYVMRNPVDRAYSHYVQRIKTGQNTRKQLEVQRTFEEAIEQEAFYLDSSDYLSQINQYLEFFPKESLRFFLMEDLINSPSTVLKQVCKFLGVDDELDLIQEQPVLANQARTHAEWFLRSRITAPLKSVPGVANTVALLPKGVRDRAYQVLKQLPFSQRVETKYIPQPMRPETRKLLLERFLESNQKLSQFLDRDLSHWNR